jgi:hypothetical protein
MKPNTVAALLFASTVCSLIQALPPGRAQDVGKHSIERPIEGLIRGGSAPMLKGAIEAPVEGVIRRSAPTLPYNSSSRAPVIDQRMPYRIGTLNSGTNPTIGPKGGIETPLEGAIRQRSASTLPYNSSASAPVMVQRRLYRSLPKSGIETPLEGAILQKSAPTSPYNLSANAPVMVQRRLYRPKTDEVRPGLVHWLPNFEVACGASAQSGKPVLLFQMMGNLNEEFC